MSKKKHRNQPKRQVAESQTKAAKTSASKIPYVVLLCIALAFSALMLSPSLRTGFVGDDALNSMAIKVGLDFQDKTIWGLNWELFTQWVTKQGRFFPLSYYVLPMFYALNNNRILYKLIMMLFTLTSILLFSTFVRRVSKSDALGIMGAFVPTLAFQYMLFHDSLLSFAGLVQLDLIAVLGGLLLFMNYLEGRGKKYLIFAVLAYLAGLLTYEILLPFFLLFFVIAWLYPERRSAKEALMKGLPFAATAIGLAIGIVIMRTVFKVGIVGGESGSTYQLSTDVGAIVVTYVKQTLGALPLWYWSHNLPKEGMQTIFMRPGQYFATYPLTSTIALAGYAALTWVAGSMATKEPKRSAAGKAGLQALALTGAGLMLLPGALISLSPRWHTELSWGVAYLPVFVGYFGIAALLMLAAYLLMRRFGKSGAGITVLVILALAAGTVGFVNLQNNRVVANRQDYMRFSRQMIGEAAERGLFGEDPEAEALICRQIAQPWDAPEFYAAHGGSFTKGVMPSTALDLTKIRPLVRSEETSGASTILRFGEDSKVAYVDYQASQASGYAISAKVVSVTLNGNAVTSMEALPLAVYLMNEPPVTKVSDSFTGPTNTTEYVFSLQLLGLQNAANELAGSGQGWQLYRFTQPGLSVIQP